MEMEKLKNKRLLYFLKFFVSLSILYFIFRKIDFKQFYCNFFNINLITILILLVTTIIKLVTQIFNWGIYLRLWPNYKFNLTEIIRTHFIGSALRFLLPGGHATLGKVFFVENKKSSTFISIGVEKFFQIWINLLAASIAACFYFQNLHIILKFSMVILMVFLPFLVKLFSKIVKREIVKNFFYEYEKIIYRIIFSQIIFVLLTILQYYVVLNNFQTIELNKVMIGVPLVLFANVIPITISGLGLRESFSIKVFAGFAILTDVAVTTSLTIFIFNSVLPGLVGLYFIIKKPRTEKARG